MDYDEYYMTRQEENDLEDRIEAANSRCSASYCSLCRGLGTIDDETPWGVMQSPCPDCDSEENPAITETAQHEER